MRAVTPGGTAVIFQAMMTRLGIDPDSVRQVETGFDLAPFFAGEWAIENSEEASPLVLKYNSTLDMVHEVAMMEASIPFIHTGEHQIGWMQHEIWQGTRDMLQKQGLLARPVDVDKVYMMEFLRKICGGDEK